jgi:hypothetical protein
MMIRLIMSLKTKDVTD